VCKPFRVATSIRATFGCSHGSAVNVIVADEELLEAAGDPKPEPDWPS
jgi:hypothetical protein